MNVDRLTFPKNIKGSATYFGVLTWLLLYRLILITYLLSVQCNADGRAGSSGGFSRNINTETSGIDYYSGTIFMVTCHF